MQQVIRPDPAPSRWSYRLQRLMLTPGLRRLLRIGVPVTVMAAVAFAYFSDETRREAIALQLADLRDQIETRPEFMVDLLAVEGASEGVETDIREIFPYDLPASSFDLDLEHVREMIEGLPGVAKVDLRIRQGGVLMAEIVERQPVVLWRTREGLGGLDIEGIAVSELATRADRPDLPLIAGEGADKRVAEALEILRAAAPLEARVRGLVRMGERRWDLVLDRDQRILLPETNPVQALERVLVLNDVHDMLARDLVAVDLRLSGRPTIRMTPRAVEDWWRVTKMTIGTQ
ncbi:cell division protein FtsQ [Roseovarius litoreus]|uniref:Cell division protein FtsQ n=1 Tax=Roseovarius litoreus TaxID=1155722 RepID=A0A1M7CEK5_9RHOB|nr:cell division protein FtsQ/DivIB [Roseovarius litoreus]SHL65597.1 cell division protein FtsQ [Roseovarius litoreus]